MGGNDAECIDEAKDLVDALAIVGEKSEESDSFLCVLSGIGDEFESFIQNVTTRENDVSFVQL